MYGRSPGHKKIDRCRYVAVSEGSTACLLLEMLSALPRGECCRIFLGLKSGLGISHDGKPQKVNSGS